MNTLESTREISQQLSAWRQDFHMHPELGFKEIRTAGRVAELLESFGCQVMRGVGRTGVIGELGAGSPCIAIRADMDALPIQEANQVHYASQNDGVMHACGHDAHTAMLLGAARLLSRMKLNGRVRFIFQPSEESNDEDGLSGAPRMITDGALQGVDMVIAQHVDPATPVGDIRLEAGPASGGVDSFFARIIGKGGHGAAPHNAIDPIFLSAFVILGLNGIVSRKLHPFDPAVVSIGSIHGGQAENVIPRHVDISGTLRYTELKVQKQVHAEIKHAFELVRPLGGEYELRFETGNLPMVNHPEAVELIHLAAADLLGDAHILPFKKELGAEDFACFTEKVPGAMFVLGARIDGDERFGHNPRFDIDERALPVGTALLVETVLRFLSR
ncbi:MAG: amidohydrolase [Anaerolineales bacterium]|nr:amidohydrolase [Anaerolineales bacterium]